MFCICRLILFVILFSLFWDSLYLFLVVVDFWVKLIFLFFEKLLVLLFNNFFEGLILLVVGFFWVFVGLVVKLIVKNIVIVVVNKVEVVIIFMVFFLVINWNIWINKLMFKYYLIILLINYIIVVCFEFKNNFDSWYNLVLNLFFKFIFKVVKIDINLNNSKLLVFDKIICELFINFD